MAEGEYKDGIDEELEFLQFIVNEKARYAERYIEEHRRNNFWFRRTPCWQLTNCPDSVKNACPTPKYPALPCWQIEGTYCKLDERHAGGLDTSICRLCPVYKQYGSCSPLQIKLFCSGIDTSITTVAKSGGTRILN